MRKNGCKHNGNNHPAVDFPCNLLDGYTDKAIYEFWKKVNRRFDNTENQPMAAQLLTMLQPIMRWFHHINRNMKPTSDTS